MKYKCFCHVENVEDLTNEEIHMMLRKSQYRRFKAIEFIENYGLTPKSYLDFLKSKKVRITGMDRVPYWDEGSARFEKEKEIKSELPSINNNISDIKPIELIAMRMFRDYDRLRFSKICSLRKYEIEWYETGRLPILKAVADEYIKVLDIKERHLVQLREIITGQSKSIVDRREIPVTIKLKVWKKYKGECAHCKEVNKLHYHHIKHFSQGGRHTVENLKLLCVSCHAEEHKGERAYNLIKSGV